MTTVYVIATSITLLDTLSERVYIDDIVNQLVHMMKLFKVTYGGYMNGGDGLAFVFAKDEFDAIRKVIEHENTEYFTDVKCEQVRKSGVIYNDNGVF